MLHGFFNSSLLSSHDTMFACRSPRGLLLATTLFSTCLAQSHNNTTDSCPEPTLFNSTGQISFQFEAFPTQDWDFSLILRDYRNPRSVYQPHVFYSYISSPPATLTKGCWYSFGGINASTSGPGANGCEGVLSDECIDLLSEIFYPTGGDGEDVRCETTLDQDWIREACPDEILADNIVCMCLHSLSL